MLGQTGVDALFHAVKVHKYDQELVKEITVVKIFVRVKIVINETVSIRGLTGVIVLHLVVKALNIVQELVKAIIVMKI